MGGWQLEAFKFAACISIPVISFYFYHNTTLMEMYYDKYYQREITERQIRDEEMMKEAFQRLNRIGEKRFQKELDAINAANAAKSKED